MTSRSRRPRGRRRLTARCSPTANKHLMGQLCRGPTDFHRLQNPAHLHHHILHSPPGVSLDADGGSPSPAVAMESVDQNRNHPALLAPASLPAPMTLPTLTSLPAPAPIPRRRCRLLPLHRWHHHDGWCLPGDVPCLDHLVRPRQHPQ